MQIAVEQEILNPESTIQDQNDHSPTAPNSTPLSDRPAEDECIKSGIRWGNAFAGLDSSRHKLRKREDWTVRRIFYLC
jgi:hypothetical protein